MKKLLVPTDFSTPSQQALNYTVNIALKTNAEIKLLHVGERDGFLDGLSGDLEDLINLNNKEKHIQFDRAINNIAEAFNGFNWQDIPIECQHVKGDIVKEVTNACYIQGIDLLVTAMKGTSGWGDVFLGSTAERIIKKVNCPVLALPEKCNWKQIQKITFATDLTPFGLKAITQMHNFAQMFDAQFNFIHIKLEEKRSYLKQVEKFRLMADEAIGHDKYEIIEIEANDVIEGLNHYASTNPIDILAMLRHKRSNLNKLFTISYAETMTAHAEIPVLMFSE